MIGERLLGTRRWSLLVASAGALACVLHPAPAMAGAVITVGTNGEQFATIQAAVDASVDGDIVLVSSGTYTGAVSLVGKNIQLVSQNTSYPSYFVITSSAQEVILLGAGNVAPVLGVGGTVIAGFTIRGGAKFGINCDSSAATIQSCVVTANGPTSGTNDGAGIFKARGTISFCTISGNFSRGPTLGGAGALLGLGAQMHDCIVTGNTSFTAAGGGVAAQDTAVSIVNCTFTENLAPSGGAIAHFAGEVRQCLLEDNQSTGTNTTEGGGAIAFATLGATGAITQNTINHCTSDSYGGGIFKCTGGVISRNRILDCTAFGNGGGIADYQGGEIQNNIIYRNYCSSHGGGVYLSDSDLLNNTICFNHAGGRGGAARSVTGLIRNDILWDNVADVDEPKLSNCSQQKYCCYNGAATGSPNFNRAGDPIFADLTSADHTVWNFTPTSSSCQQTGKDLTSVLVDFFGTVRPSGGSDDYDIGAIEF